MTKPTTDRIVRAGREDVRRLSRALARAFQDDPVFEWVFPDPGRRHERLPGVFTAFVDLYLPYEASFLAGDGVGAALWAPAGSPPFSEEQLEVFGEAMSTALGGDAERAMELDAILEAHHPDEACSYLQFMGVVPDHQGQGIGSEMLSVVLEECDRTGTPAYLEATSRDNRRLYERHGFQTIAEIRLPEGPSLWSMWRRPG